MRKRILALALAPVLLLGAGAAVASPEKTPVPSIKPFTLFGKTWCFGDAPTTQLCHVKIPLAGGATAKASASNAHESWLSRWLEVMRGVAQGGTKQTSAGSPTTNAR